MLRNAVLLTPLFIAAGCSCNQEYSFPKQVTVTTEDPDNFGAWLSMDTAPDGVRLVVSYYDKVAGALGFAVGLPSEDGSVNWVHEQVDGYTGDDGLDRSNRGMYSSVKVAPDGTVWVAYHDVDNGGLYYGHRTGPGLWETGLVDAGTGSSPNAGQWASLDIDSAGTPVISHYDAGAKVLRVSTWSGEGWTNETAYETEARTVPGDSGTEELIEADAGAYSNLLIHDDVQYIAFFDATWGSLHLLEGTSDGYVHTLVTDGGSPDIAVGQWPNILHDGEELHISYHDVTNQNMMVTSRNSAGSWNEGLVDSRDYVGADSDLILVEDDLAVVYFDGFNNNMKLGKRQSGLWTTDTLAGETTAVGFHNETTMAGGQVWAASYNYSDQTLYIQALP